MHSVGGPRPLDYMMAQEEILEDMEKEAQIQPKEELEEVNLGADLGPLRPIFISSQLSAKGKGAVGGIAEKICRCECMDI